MFRPCITKRNSAVLFCVTASWFLLLTLYYILDAKIELPEPALRSESINSRTITGSSVTRTEISTTTEDKITSVGKEAEGSQTNSIPSMLERNYTILYRKVSKAANYSSLFFSSENGNHHVRKEKWLEMRNATEELVLSAPELFQKIPRHFLEDFKNPCWVRGESGLNCLPYFYVIGMHKCGTTDIWDKITAHPDVIDNPKEPHWWGPRRHGFKGTPIHRPHVRKIRQITGGGDDSSLEWYLNFHKAYAVPQILNSPTITSNGRRYHRAVFGDASITTAYTLGTEWLEKFPNATEPPFTNADLLHAVQPQAKIIVMIRNPTDRANSWFWYSHARNGTAEMFHDLATRLIHCFNECLRSHSLKYCAYAGGCPYNFIPDINVGIYHVYLRDWIRAFSRDGVMVIRLEDWKSNPDDIYRKLLAFLELRPLSAEKISAILHRQSKNVYKRKHEPVWNETKRALDEFYRPYHEELAKVMNDNSFLYS